MGDENKKWHDSLNVKKTCAAYRVSIWQCPQFLFLVMGLIIISAIIVSYLIASRYGEPEVASLVVLGLAAFLMIVSNMIVKAFEKVALASLSKSEFISIMSHQLRSPLSAIKWQMNVLLSDDPKIASNLSSNAAKGYFERIDEQNERMIKAVNDLLAVNRIEDKELVLRPAKFDLFKLSQKCADEYQRFGAANNVSIKITGKEGTEVFADESYVKQVVEHLLDNAVRYSLKGGEITITLEVNGGKAVWKITDRGAGMSPEDQKRIFEKFFRSKSVTLYQTEGSGVGLFIARAIIEKSKGKIGFVSEKNQGSTFWFALPVAGEITS